MFRSLIDDLGNLGNDAHCFRMLRVKQASQSRQLRFRNRRVPEISGPENNINILRQIPLQSIDVNRRVEKEFWERRLEARQKTQLGAVTVFELFLAFLWLQSAQRLLKRGARTQG